ncbi:MAG: hypothetical protein Q8916_08330 [Bacteroidota bacterium]|nr:hypothetical protein [Bacteroidota bacterium]MDP4230392.1 hypothetical protein [Bacteroidota bacterium]MDP4235824.1 hypothetical protein [Bacteroidota bacterium]
MRRRIIPSLLSILFVLFSAAAFGTASDSTRIVHDLTARFKKIRSGSITYTVELISPNRSKPLQYRSTFDFSCTGSDTVIRLVRYDIGIEDFFIHDTDFEALEFNKHIDITRNTLSEFLDDFGDVLWITPFNIGNILTASDPDGYGRLEYSDTSINGDTCYRITSVREAIVPEFDSVKSEWIISKNNCSHSHFERVSWGKGITDRKIMQCIDASYSEFPDPMVKSLGRADFQRLEHDSAYLIQTR